MYNHGDEYYICDYCGRKLKTNKFSSDTFSELIKNNWKYYVNYHYELHTKLKILWFSLKVYINMKK